MTFGRSLHTLAPYQDAPGQGRLILRDGTTATIRVSRPEDRTAVHDFYRRLSPESRRMRFFSENKPAAEMLDPMCESGDPDRQLTLLVFRHAGGSERIVAMASYIAHKPGTAEFAVAVDDAFQGRGMGGLLLERLTVLAAARGFNRFVAVVDPSNRSMLDTFRNSGFALKEKSDGDCIEFDISVEPRAESVARAELRDRMFTKASIRPFFNPQSVAVVGASRDPGSIGHRIMEALVLGGFTGPVYPVNPSAQVVCSLKAYPRVSAIPEPVDLAIVAVPKEGVLSVVDDCAVRGVRALIVISTGFAEAGAAGAQLQQELVDKVRGYGMRLVGPNCLGVVNTHPDIRLNASFSPTYPPHGRIALSSQSGALGLAILNLARQRDLGLSMFISMGNKADVTGNDLLQYWEDDPSADVVLLYLESFGNPRRFARIARRVSRSKPIVCVKSGRHRKLSDAAVDALFHQTGVIRANTLQDMFEIASLLGNQPLPAGRRVAILTNSHGSGVLCTDACASAGLQVVSPSADTATALKALLPEDASPGAIVDLSRTAGPSEYQAGVERCLADPGIDAVIAIYIPLGVAEVGVVARGIAQGVARGRAAGCTGKPVLAVAMTDENPSGFLSAPGERIPRYLFPETAAHVLGTAADYAEWKKGPQGSIIDFENVHPDKGREICRSALATRGPTELTLDELDGLLTAFGIGRPMPAATEQPLQIRVVEDATFGPLIALDVALPGASIRRDASVRVTPLTDRDASEMVSMLRREYGYGDALQPDLFKQLEELLLRVSLMVEEIPEINYVEFKDVRMEAPGEPCSVGWAYIRTEPVRGGQPQRFAGS